MSGYAIIPSMLFCTASLFALACVQPALAQGGDQPAASNPSGLEEIVVTARRREEKLQSVPLAITALNAHDLEEHEVQTTEDLQHLVPSFTVNVGALYRDSLSYTLRGQGSTQGPSVVVYFAEVPSVANGSGPGQYYDLESVQVLKGPQGTLFGRNTTGGAVLFEPKKPSNEFEGYAKLTLGSYNWHEAEGAINIPIVSDKVLLRVAGNVKERDGFTKDVGPFFNGKDYDNVDYWGARAGLTIRPTDDLENYTVVSSLYNHNNGPGSSLLVVNPNFSFGTLLGLPITLGGNGPTPGSLATNFAANFAAAQAAGRFSAYPNLGAVLAAQQANGPRETALSTDQIAKEWDYGVVDIAKWDVEDNITLKNVAGYFVHKQLQRWDLDASSLPLVDTNTPSDWSYNTSQSTEEFQVQGKSFRDALTWVTGLYYEFDHPIAYDYTQAIELGGFNPANPTATPFHGETQRSQAVYAQGTYDLAQLSPILEGLKFTAGYRYTWDYRSDYNFQYTVSNGVCTQRAGFHFPDCSVVEDGQFHAGTYTIGLDYQFDPDTLLYVTSRRGYKSGGFNVNFPGNNFAPEYVEDVELGVKSDWNFMGIKGRTDVAAYHSDYTNIQTSAAIFNNGQAGNIIVNGAAATIDGIEVEATVIPVASVELAATYAYTHAKYDQVAANVTTVQIGTPFLNTPLNKGSLTARYHLPIGQDLGDLSVSSTFSYQTHSVVSTGNGAYDGQGSYSLLDFRVDWNSIAGMPVDLSFFITNATDTVYKVGVLDLFTSLGYDDALYNEPRMFGAQLKYRFGGPAPEPEAAPAAYVPPPAAVPAAAPKSYLVFFDFNKSDLTPQAVTIVDQAAHDAGPAKVARLEVTGHTDTVGSDAYNMRLSRRRAESVAAQLEKDGISSSEISIVAKGKRDLLVPTADGVKEPQNRRVQIVYDGGPVN